MVLYWIYSFWAPFSKVLNLMLGGWDWLSYSWLQDDKQWTHRNSDAHRSKRAANCAGNLGKPSLSMRFQSHNLKETVTKGSGLFQIITHKKHFSRCSEPQLKFMKPHFSPWKNNLFSKEAADVSPFFRTHWGTNSVSSAGPGDLEDPLSSLGFSKGKLLNQS